MHAWINNAYECQALNNFHKNQSPFLFLQCALLQKMHQLLILFLVFGPVVSVVKLPRKTNQQELQKKTFTCFLLCVALELLRSHFFFCSGDIYRTCHKMGQCNWQNHSDTLSIPEPILLYLTAGVTPKFAPTFNLACTQVFSVHKLDIFVYFKYVSKWNYIMLCFPCHIEGFESA